MQKHSVIISKVIHETKTIPITIRMLKLPINAFKELSPIQID